MDKFSIIKSPLTTESAMKKIEENNTLVFLVNKRATKPQIKIAVKEMYDIDAVRVNTLIRPDGEKKAYVRLSPDADALELANKVRVCGGWVGERAGWAVVQCWGYAGLAYGCEMDARPFDGAWYMHVLLDWLCIYMTCRTHMYSPLSSLLQIGII